MVVLCLLAGIDFARIHNHATRARAQVRSEENDFAMMFSFRRVGKMMSSKYKLSSSNYNIASRFDVRTIHQSSVVVSRMLYILSTNAVIFFVPTYQGL